MDGERKRLWEVDHPYYMSAGCYYARGAECHNEFESWADFLEEWADADEDYNWIIRWDWREGEGWDLPPGQAQLCVQFFMQRKAYPVSNHVAVTRDDEPAIYEYLAKSWAYMQKMWAPFAAPTEPQP